MRDTFLQELSPCSSNSHLNQDVTVISPTAYFAFTPLLAGCAVGTLEFRSTLEPVRVLLYISLCYVSRPNRMIEGEAVCEAGRKPSPSVNSPGCIDYETTSNCMKTSYQAWCDSIGLSSLCNGDLRGYV